jgi:hypothetical protein
MWYSGCHVVCVQVRLNMTQMSGLARALVSMILLTLLFSFGCSRPTPNVPSEGVTQTSATPFQSQGTSARDASPQGSSRDDVAGTEPPFQNSAVLPAGALLTVRLRVPLVAENGSKASFEAILDEPVAVDGNTLIPRDAIVSGRVESARTSKARPDRDYVRLSLDFVQVDGSAVPIETASLFARQRHSSDADSTTIRLEKGRRLTFRLKEPIFLHPTLAKTAQ